MRPERLELDPEEIRAAGHRMVELLVDRITGLGDRPVGRRTGREELERLLREEPPEHPSDPEAVLERLAEVLSHVVRVDHPRFFAFVPGPGNVMGALTEALTAAVNVFAGTWLEASGPSQVELVTVEWLRELCGLPEGGGGLFLSGGSAANLTALAAALHHTGAGRSSASVYWSDQTHSSVDRAARVLGIGRIDRIPADGEFRLPLPALRRSIEEDRATGRIPLVVVANAGTTNTGAVDPLPELADLCSTEGLWLHVDGAYGAAAVLTDRGRVALEGMGRADSLALDPHKWLFQPYEMGCLLVRRAEVLPEAFSVLPEYLRDIRGPAGEVNLCDWGLQLTRSARALKLWASLQTFGLEAFRAAVTRGLDLAEHAQTVLEGSEDWEVVTPARLGIVTFRHRTADAEDLAARLLRDGFAFLSTTELRGERVLRMCTINPRTGFEDVEATISRLEELA